MAGEKILMHCCCGPCSSACIERLAPDYDMTLFFYNPCIDDEAEYEKRKATLIGLVEEINRNGCVGVVPEGPAGENAGAALTGVVPLAYGPVKVVEGKYDPDSYLEAVRGLEGEPEGGARCAVCFRMRLKEAARYAKEQGFDGFTTTLTVSPHKNFRVISDIGREVADEVGIEYYPFDFKKKDGFLHSIRLSKAYGLYRQDYCGCRFSKR